MVSAKNRCWQGSSKDLKGLLAANCIAQVLERGLTMTNVYGTDLSTDKSFYRIVTAAEHAFKILVWLEGLHFTYTPGNRIYATKGRVSVKEKMKINVRKISILSRH